MAFLRPTEWHHRGRYVVILWASACFFIGAGGYSGLSWAQGSKVSNTTDPGTDREITLIGPHQKNSPKVPQDPGFWSFAIAEANIISRSGQPTITGFRWLKDNGWKSVIDLRLYHDDGKIEGFNDLQFKYLALPIPDLSVPSDQQAQEFLDFVSDPANQPVHVHCRMGVGRTGVMIALYRYMIEAWPMDKAINEAQLFGDLSKVQSDWLNSWAQKHIPGSYEKTMRL